MLLTPTHRDGGTLDLVLTKSEQDLDDVNVNTLNILCDLSLISWHLLMHQSPIIADHEVRGLEASGQGQVPGGFAFSPSIATQICIREYFDVYHNTL